MTAAPIRPAPLRMPQLRVLPDVVSHARAAAEGRLDRVGMQGIDLPLLVRDAAGQLLRVPARADAFVSLDAPEAKGIHMSRLFLLLQETVTRQELSPLVLEQLLHAFLRSHATTSRSAEVALRFDHLVERPSLESGNHGWRRYPVELAARLVDGRFRAELAATIAYSSTCPCSAALARQLIQERLLLRFAGRGALRPEEVAAWLGSEDGVCATPHAQRSHADVRVVLAPPAAAEAPVLWLIDSVEAAVGTPVQAAVKREDEQAFALLNGENPMFCEDAARRIRAALEAEARVADWRIEVRHEESLHPHDAVAKAVKGVPGGLAL